MPTNKPFAIGSRLELFLDEELIQHLQGARRHLHEPRPAGVAIRADRPWDGIHNWGFQVIPDGDVFRMYYRAWPEGSGTPDLIALGYAESPDGKSWTKPDLRLIRIQGSCANNLCAVWPTLDGADRDSRRAPLCGHEGGHGMLVSKLAPFLDARPGVSHGERAKAIRPVSVRLGVADAYLYGSSDWREWKPLGDRAMFRSEIYNSFDSQNHPFWSPAEGRYVCIYRIMIDDVRTMACTDSADLHRWRDPQPVRYEGAAGDGTVPPFQVYTHQTEPYFRAPHLYVALAARFMQGRRALTDEQAAAIPIPELLAEWAESEEHTYPRPEDCSDAVLLVCRAGSRRFHIPFPEAFIRPGLGPTNWTTRTNYPLKGIVPTGPAEMSIYVNRDFGHPSWYVERMTLRTDGFVSVRAPAAGGELLTKPLSFAGDRLLLNYSTSAAGGLSVEVRDAAGSPIPGFAFSDCRQLIGDEIEGAVRWNGGGLSRLAGRPVRLLFRLADADVYSFRFAPPFSTPKP